MLLYTCECLYKCVSLNVIQSGSFSLSPCFFFQFWFVILHQPLNWEYITPIRFFWLVIFESMDKFLMDWHQHDSNKVDEKKLKHRRKGARRYIYTYLYAYVNSNFGCCCVFFTRFFMYSNIVYYLIWYFCFV